MGDNSTQKRGGAESRGSIFSHGASSLVQRQHLKSWCFKPRAEAASLVIGLQAEAEAASLVQRGIPAQTVYQTSLVLPRSFNTPAIQH
jgi:hypothetical protein